MQKLFKYDCSIKIVTVYKGKIFSGFGKGAIYLEKFRSLYEKYIKFRYYAGTLNILSNKNLFIPTSAIYVPKNTSPELNQGVYFIPAKLFNEDVFIVFPERSDHPKNVLEIISRSNIKEKYNLSDGQYIEIIVT